MIRKTLVVLALFVMAAPLWAGEPMTDADKKMLLDHLEHTKLKFLESIDGLSAEQWTWKAAPERWSIAECSEHIIKSEGLIRGLISGAMGEVASDELLASGVRKDEMILTAVVDRSQKFQAPEPLLPSGMFADAAAASAAFGPERASTVELAGSGDLRMHVAEHPVLGQLDAYGWILFLSAHTERHTLQILEVKEAEGFPAGHMH